MAVVKEESLEALSVAEHEPEGRDQEVGGLLDRLGGSISGRSLPIRGPVKVLPLPLLAGHDADVYMTKAMVRTLETCLHVFIQRR